MTAPTSPDPSVAVVATASAIAPAPPAPRTLVHLSDLHFGRLEPRVLGPLAAAVRACAPDLVVVSGDLTQRARTAEFVAARRFLQSLGTRVLVVPGNHDVPLYNVAQRLLQPLAAYDAHLGRHFDPAYAGPGLAAWGLVSARGATLQGGRVNVRQLARMQRFLAHAEGLRAVVLHHPIDTPAPGQRHGAVGRAPLALWAMRQAGVDLVLSGHRHAAGARLLEIGAEGDPPRTLVLVQAGTLSERVRGEPGSFNRLRVAPGRIEVERLDWSPAGGTFPVGAAWAFESAGERGWRTA